MDVDKPWRYPLAGGVDLTAGDHLAQVANGSHPFADQPHIRPNRLGPRPIQHGSATQYQVESCRICHAAPLAAKLENKSIVMFPVL